jgi:suppressor of ftsI
MTEISRREVVAGSAALALTTASSSALALQAKAKAAVPKQNVINLECAFKDVTIDGTKMQLRAYNGQIPGPLMKIFPGQTVRITVKNSLLPYDSTGWDGEHNVPHHLGSTNLHLHGMDVIPHLSNRSAPPTPRRR